MKLWVVIIIDVLKKGVFITTINSKTITFGKSGNKKDVVKKGHEINFIIIIFFLLNFTT